MDLEKEINMQEDKVKSFLNILESLDNKSSLDEVVKAFEMVIELAKQTRDLTEEEIKNLRSMFVEARDELKSFNSEKFETLKARLIGQITDKIDAIRDGRDGKDGRDGVDGKDGRDGKDGVDGKDGSTDTGEQIVNKINNSEGLIKKEKVDGLDEEFNKVNENIQSVRIARVGGGGKGVQLYVNGVKRGLAQYVDIVGGGSTTVSTNLVNGLHTITISSTGGAGFTELVATETPNGSRTQFTFATASAQPSFIVVDNVWMKATTATGGVNWTWNGGTKVATLTIPAVDDIWGVA